MKIERIGDYRSRIKVPHGWIYQVELCDKNVSTCFIPDPQHEWDLKGTNNE